MEAARYRDIKKKRRRKKNSISYKDNGKLSYKQYNNAHISHW